MSYAVWAVALAFVADRLVMGTVSLVGWAIAQPTNPTDFFGSMAYMLYNMWPTFVQGIVNTVIIALVGTVVAFFLALALVFLRVQEPDRSDNDFVRLMKVEVDRALSWRSTPFTSKVSSTLRDCVCHL